MLYGTDVAPPIGEYGVIGDCRSAALISRQGSLDWLCWPWFDSPSLFGAILDTEKGGFWRIAPAGAYQSTRRYLPGTNVLETEFQTATGRLRLTDCMPVYEEDYQRKHLIADREILRVIECLSGEVRLHCIFSPAPNYGSYRMHWRQTRALGIHVQFIGGALWLRSDVDWRIGDGYARCETVLRAGDRRYCSLVMMEHGPAVLSPLRECSDAALAQTVNWWQKWSSHCGYQGPFRDDVIRSALVLKLLNFSPSGAIVAAPTTSLPERIGGELNWDYRYCWLRDASLTVSALFGLGYHDEAEGFIEWLLHSTNLTQPRLLVLYTLYGKRAKKERALGWKGYRNSRPVRVGNDARHQIQLDVYGEVVSAAAQLDEYDKVIDHASSGVLRGIGKYVAQHWQTADKGIWEPRSEAQHHTHSKLMCWVAMKKLLHLHESGLLRSLDTDEVSRTCERIATEIKQRAWNNEIQSYTAIFEGKEVDASLLLLAKHEFERADSDRMRNTYRRIVEDLSPAPGLVCRYRGNLSPGEGAFGICCFWAAEYLALGGGSLEQAEAHFRTVLGYRNDLGLFAEEIDPATGAALGNFPQAFTHVGLINAALTLAERGASEKRGEPSA